MITLENTKTLYDLLANAGKEYASKTFIKYEKEDVFYDKTYSQLFKDSCSFGAWVQEQQEEKQGAYHVAMIGRCSYRYLVSIFGTVSAGGIAIPLDIQASEEVLIENITRAEIDALLFDWEYSVEVEAIMRACPGIKHCICMQKMQEQNIPELCKIYENHPFVPAAKEEECAMIIFTSGTTGKGKGVMLSHGNLIDNLFSSTETEDQSFEVCMNVLPIHHIFCLSGDVFLIMRYGSLLCLCPDVSKIMTYIPIYMPTSIRVVPMISKMLYNRIAMTKKRNPELSDTEVKDMVLGKRFHKIISGGGYLAKDLAMNFAKLGITIGQGYGMSECSPKISAPDYECVEKLDSVGKVVERCQVRIVDGEIQVSSPSVMMGYYKEPELTKEVITEDGWLCTGDMGYVDEEGYIYLTGRKKNLIILSNGENVAPEGIENRFDNEALIQDILVYGEGDAIAAAVYPNFEYAQMQNITDIEQAVQEIINKKNEELPPFSKIVHCTVRKHPFEKTSSKKIIREKFFEAKAHSETKKSDVKRPQTEMQQTLYDIVAEITGNELLDVSEDLYTSGLDSLGSVLLIEEVDRQLGRGITLSDLLEYNTIEKLEAFLSDVERKDDIDLSVREVYPLTNIQKYFAYIIKGNTTSNLPFLFKLHSDIDLERLKAAIGDMLDAHPGLKANIHFDGQQYMVFRDDSRQIDIPVLKLSEQEWQKKKETLVVPFAYTQEDNLVHACLCETEENKYMFIDVAHVVGDGITINIILEDINNRYCGEELEKESYTFYEYILEDQARMTNGLRERDIKAAAELMKDVRLDRSILNQRQREDAFAREYGVIRSRLTRLNRKKIMYFCKKNGVSENVMFVTAFNYLVYLFSDEEDVFCNSIHSGRTDSRYSRLAGALFTCYFCRFTKEPHEKVLSLLKRTGKQIMNTMKSTISMSRQGEVFFQYQGDILGQDSIGGLPAEREHIQLDALPFHLQVMSDNKGYYQELRYWANRFDKDQLQIFIDCLEAVVLAMLDEPSVRRLKRHLPEEVYPKHFYISIQDLNQEAGFELVAEKRAKRCKVYILDESYKKKPYGAWGTLYIMDYKPKTYTKELENPYGDGVLYETDMVARILPDRTLDFLENNGRTVVTDGIHGLRQFYLKDVEQALLACEGVKTAKAYLYYDTDVNEMSLTADVALESGKTTEKIMEEMQSKYEGTMLPKVIREV
ncbi:MAG: AMP-binding protein [Clostridium sp.]|nr:AMP-binding protein [Clostridium sp.]